MQCGKQPISNRLQVGNLPHDWPRSLRYGFGTHTFITIASLNGTSVNAPAE